MVMPTIGMESANSFVDFPIFHGIPERSILNHNERLKQKIHLTIMITIIIYKWMMIVIIAF